MPRTDATATSQQRKVHVHGVQKKRSQANKETNTKGKGCGHTVIRQEDGSVLRSLHHGPQHVHVPLRQHVLRMAAAILHMNNISNQVEKKQRKALQR
jgi:hypothetical protein